MPSIIKDLSQTPVEMAVPPPSNVNPGKSVNVGSFLSLQYERPLVPLVPYSSSPPPIPPPPMPMDEDEDPMSPLTASEPADYDPDPDR